MKYGHTECDRCHKTIEGSSMGNNWGTEDHAGNCVMCGDDLCGTCSGGFYGEGLCLSCAKKDAVKIIREKLDRAANDPFFSIFDISGYNIDDAALRDFMNEAFNTLGMALFGLSDKPDGQAAQTIKRFMSRWANG